MSSNNQNLFFKKGQVIQIYNSHNKTYKSCICQFDIHSLYNCYNYEKVFDPEHGLEPVYYEPANSWIKTPYIIKKFEEFKTLISKISLLVGNSFNKLHESAILKILNPLTHKLNELPIFENNLKEDRKLNDKLNKELNILFDTMLEDLKQYFLAHYRENHEMYFDYVKKVTAKLEKLEKSLEELKKRTASWPLLDQFEYLYSQAQQELKPLKERFVPLDLTKHEISLEGCSCGYKYITPNDIQEWENLQLLFKKIQNHFNQWDPKGGELYHSYHRVILEALFEEDGRIGRRALKLILKGSNNLIITEGGFANNRQFGKLRQYTLDQIKEFINHIIKKGHIKVINFGKYYPIPILIITQKGHRFLNRLNAPSSLRALVRDDSITKILGKFKYKPLRDMILSLSIEYNRTDVLKALLNLYYGFDFDRIVHVIRRHTKLVHLFFSVILDALGPITNQKKVVNILKELSQEDPNSGWNLLLASLNELEASEIVNLFKISDKTDRELILTKLLENNQVAPLIKLIPFFKQNEFNKLFAYSKEHSTQKDFHQVLNAIFFKRDISKRARQKAYSLLQQFSTPPQIVFPIDLHTAKHSQIIELFQTCISVEKEYLLQQLINYGRSDVIDAIFQKLKKTDTTSFWKVLSNDPPEEYASFLYSILIDNTYSENVRRKALAGLKQIYEKNPKSPLAPLLAALPPFEDGRLKKEIQQLLHVAK